MKHAIAAIAAAALLAAVPARAAEPRESASHEIKLTCVIYNALLVSIYDSDSEEDDPTRKAAQENGEQWSEVLLVDAGGDEAKVMTEVNQRLDAVMAGLGGGTEEEQMTFLIQKLADMQKVCERYDS